MPAKKYFEACFSVRSFDAARSARTLTDTRSAGGNAALISASISASSGRKRSRICGIVSSSLNSTAAVPTVRTADSASGSGFETEYITMCEMPFSRASRIIGRISSKVIAFQFGADKTSELHSVRNTLDSGIPRMNGAGCGLLRPLRAKRVSCAAKSTRMFLCGVFDVGIKPQASQKACSEQY